jgi:glucuronosyltransferase
LQSRVLDQPQTPLERAVFWTEYVLRHNGAAHMRSAAVDLNWIQLNLIDVYLAIFVGLSIPALLTFCIFKRLICKLCGKSCQKKTQVSKQKKKN